MKRESSARTTNISPSGEQQPTRISPSQRTSLLWPTGIYCSWIFFYCCSSSLRDKSRHSTHEQDPFRRFGGRRRKVEIFLFGERKKKSISYYPVIRTVAPCRRFRVVIAWVTCSSNWTNQPNGLAWPGQPFDELPLGHSKETNLNQKQSRRGKTLSAIWKCDRSSRSLNSIIKKWIIENIVD